MADTHPTPPLAQVPPDRLLALITWFEQLQAENLAQLADFYHPQVHFRDPFNDVHSLPAMAAIFDDMFKQLHTPKFKVTHWAMRAETVFLAWDFDFEIRILGRNRSQHIQGVSQLLWQPQPSGQWLVIAHLDHWDAAEQVYAKLPVLGTILGWLKRRLAA